MIRRAALFALLGLAACHRPAREPAATGDVVGGDRAPLAARDCGHTQGDSARVVCLALNEVERIGGSRAALTRFLVLGDTTCVETGPDNLNTVDGGGAVQIVRGRVVWAEVQDSTGCAGGRPRPVRLPAPSATSDR